MKSTVAAIEFGSSKVVTLVGEGSGSSAAQLLGFGVVPYDGYSEGHWNMPDEDVDQAIMNSIREAELSSGREIREIYVGVPAAFIHIEQNEVSLTFDTERRIAEEDVDELMAKALSHSARDGWVVIHRSPAWFRVGERTTMEPVGLRGDSMRCMASFVTADPSFLEDVQARLESQSVRIIGYLSPSLGQALMLIPPEERDRIAVLVDVGYLNTEILFVRGDALVYQEVFGLGGGHITADLAYGLKFTMEMAEELKRKFTFGAGQDLSATDSSGREVHVSRERAAEIILPRAEEIADEAQKIIERAGVRLDSRSVFYLTGGGLMMRGNREYVSNIFERSVKTPQPMAVKLNSPMYSAALGLLELVYESVSQLDLKPDASGKKGGKFGQMVKGFFTK